MTKNAIKIAKPEINDLILAFLEASSLQSLLEKGRQTLGYGLAFRFHNSGETIVSSESTDFLSCARSYPYSEITRLYESRSIVDGSTVRGHLFLDRQPGFKGGQALEALVIGLQFILRREMTEERDRRLFINRFFEDLIMEKIPSEQEIRKRAGILGIPVEENVMILIISGLSPDRQDFVMGRIRAYFKRTYCVVVKGVLAVVLFPGNIEPELVRKSIVQLFDRIHPEISKSEDEGGEHLHFGIGEPRSSVLYLYESYEEARNAMFYSMVHRRNKPVFWKDTAAFGLMCALAKSDEARSLCDLRLGAIIDHDEKNRTNLLETLYVIESCNWNLAGAAKKSLYHYNTLKYRFGKIQQLLNDDLKDSALRFDLAFALRIYSVRSLLKLYG
jgi:purine catabolism regulator